MGAAFRQKLKVWILPLAMVCGVLFHDTIDSVQFLAPYLIFAMLLITFSRIEPSNFRISGLAWSVVGVQVIGGMLLFLAFMPFNDDFAQGAMICVLCPTATAAPVITAMLGGSITTLISVSVLSNLAAAVVAPAMFSLISPVGVAQISFLEGFSAILAKVGPMIIGPMLLALFIRRFIPRLHAEISGKQSWSFYIWAVSLIIVVGRAVSFAIAEPIEKIPEMLVLALIALVMCVAQFAIGRRLGSKYGDKVAGTQSLGQKNTVLAVWMAVNFLNPISSIAPAAYVAWQNILNSLQIYLNMRSKRALNN